MTSEWNHQQIYNSLIVTDAVLLYAKLMLVKSRLPPWIVIRFSQS